MELNFTKEKGGLWVSEFSVNDDWNLTLQFDTKDSSTSVEERQYTDCEWDETFNTRDTSICKDFMHAVYPKYIRIECLPKPKIARIKYNEL